MVTKRTPSANAVIKVDTVHKRHDWCVLEIKLHTEVLTAYGSGYFIPN